MESLLSASGQFKLREHFSCFGYQVILYITLHVGGLIFSRKVWVFPTRVTLLTPKAEGCQFCPPMCPPSLWVTPAPEYHRHCGQSRLLTRETLGGSAAQPQEMRVLRNALHTTNPTGSASTAWCRSETVLSMHRGDSPQPNLGTDVKMHLKGRDSVIVTGQEPPWGF